MVIAKEGRLTSLRCCHAALKARKMSCGGPDVGVRGPVEQKTGFRKHRGDSGYEGRGKWTAFKSPFSLVGAYSAQRAIRRWCRSVAKMGAPQLAIPNRVAKNRVNGFHLAICCLAIHPGQDLTTALNGVAATSNRKPPLRILI
jgi:hypothetical protein